MMLFAMNTRRELPAAIHRRKRKRRGMQARRDRQQDQNPANFKTKDRQVTGIIERNKVTWQ